MESRYVLYRAFLGFTCQAPVFALFCLSEGLDYRGLMTLVLAFAAAKVLCDVPSGIFADRVGRRAAILARVGLEAVSVALLFDRQFLASSILAGAACAFSSGAEAALVYERHGADFARVFGRGSAWGCVSTALAAAAGGALALVSFDLVYALRLAALVAAGIPAAGFPRSIPAEGAVREAGPRPVAASLLRVLALAGLLGAVQVAALQLQQPYLLGAGVPLAAFGALYVGLQLVTAAGARLAHRLPRALPAVALVSAAGFAAMAALPGLAGVAGILLLKFAHGLSLPAFGRALNERARPGARATSLSLRSLFEGAALLGAAPLLGWTAQSLSLQAAFGVAALLVIPGFLLAEAPCVSSSGSPARA